MLNRILAVFKKEFVQLRRDHRAAAMAVIIPLIWLVIFGYAANFNVRSLPTVLLNQSTSELGYNLAAAVKDEPVFDIVDIKPQSRKSIIRTIKDGKAKVGIYIPKDYGVDSDAVPQFYTDGTDLFSSQAALGNGLKVFQAVNKEAAMEQKEQAIRSLKATPFWALVPKDLTEAAVPAPPKVIHLFNPDLKSANVMIPGLVGMVLLFILTLMTALGVVREREKGTLEQLIVTPIRPIELMIGKILPYVFIGIADFALVFTAGLVLFDVPFQGSCLPFTIASLAFLVCSLGLGLLISTVSQNQQQAMQLAMLALFPQFILSGFVFPLESMPKAIQVIGYCLPLTHYIPVSKAAFLKGSGIAGIWTSVAVLCGYAVIMIALASVRFKKRLA